MINASSLGTMLQKTLTRRDLLTASVVTGIWTAFKDFAFAAQAATNKDLQEMQKNWKALLADGVKVPLPSEPLKLSAW